MPRRRINLNRDWRFARGDHPEAREAAFDDARWQRLGLPHAFDLPYFRTPEFYVGVGWYRRTLAVPAEWEGRRLLLEFDGAFQVAEAFVNGRSVGGHAGGYTSFVVDVTDAVQTGENVLAVRVDNHWSPRLAPRAGEHHFSGGLYRDVHLLVLDPLHLAWRGIEITTPEVSRERAVVCVRTSVGNASPTPRAFTLETEILGPDGDSVATLQTALQAGAGETATVEQRTGALPDPRLWHPDHPHLYRARTRLREQGNILDEIETPFGIRWFEWTADRGFFLNGEHFYIRGANAHQDHAGWGIAITQAAMRRDVRLLKDAGFNFVRGAHYPHHPAFARACDEIGLLFWSENCFWGKGGFGPEGYWNASAYPTHAEDFAPFEESCRTTLGEMIRDNRNSPSIVVWSMTNEAFFTYHIEKARALISDLVRLSHELDPTRPAAVGGAQRGDVDTLGDVAGYNGDGAILFLDPGVPSMVSEYGAFSKPYDAYEPFFADMQTERLPWRSGEAIWCGFDYGTIAGKQGLKGILDHYRLPKMSWHWYRKRLLGIEPPEWPKPGVPAALQLTADKTTIRGTDATDDAQIIVTVHDASGRQVDAAPTVTLLIESGPGEFPTGRSITFDASTDVLIVAGRAAMALRSYHGGTTILRASSPGLSDATIEIETLGEPRWIEGKTPPVEDRPYVPPEPSPTALASLRQAVNVARDRPSRASSARPDHPARLGNDGNLESAWLAAPDDASPWYLVDLEGFYQIATGRTVLADAGNTRYFVEISSDAKSWTLAVDRRETVNESATRNDIYDPGTVARYLRLRFTHVPEGVRPGIAEMEIFGILSVR